MKKSKKKKHSSKVNEPNSRNNINNIDNMNLGDLGLEPPKIYRQTQKQANNIMQKAQSKSQKNQQITRSEKRLKDEKKRKKRNTFRKIAVWLLVIITLLAVGVVLSLTVFFNINEVAVVKGSEKYTNEEIVSISTISTGENLFLADTKIAESLIEQRLPYIYNAQIKRKLPYTIEISVTDAIPAYCIKNENKTYILLDDNFKVLEKEAEEPQGIYILKAKPTAVTSGMHISFDDEDKAKCLNELARVVKANNFDSVTAIYSNGISDNYVIYDGRIYFKLGTTEDLENKIYQGLAACEKLNQSNPNAKGTMNITGGKSIYFTEK